MGLWQVNTLFPKGFTNCNNLPLNTLRLVELWTLRSSLFYRVTVDGKEGVHKKIVINSC